MELSGLIFVALALVWAVVLLPKALKHHDDLADPGPTDGASDRPRVLARREAVTSRSSRLVVTSEEPAPAEQQPRTRPVSARAHRAAAAAAARRRRRVLLVLLVSTAATGGATIAGPVPVWAPAVPLTLVVAFLVVARVTVRREQARWEALQAAQREGRRSGAAAVELPVEVDAERVAVEAEPSPDATAPAATAAAATGPGELSLDDTQAIGVEQLAQAQAVVQAEVLAETVPTSDSGTLWDPLPVTLPTYVGKPRATRSVRTIDLSAADVASAGRDAGASALVAEAATAAEHEGPGQRAVGS